MSGRNDDYQATYKERTRMSLESLVLSLKHTGVKAQVLFVDYNQEKPFIDELVSGVDYLTVSQKEHKTIMQQFFDSGLKINSGHRDFTREEIESGFKYILTTAHNIGVSACEGNFVVLCGSDFIYTPEVINSLANPNIKTLYRIPLKQISIENARDKFNDMVSGVPVDCGVVSKKTRIGLRFSAGCVFCIDKQSFNTIQGFMPIPVVRGKGSDIVFAYCAAIFGCRFCVCDASLFDIEHSKKNAIPWKDSTINTNNRVFSYSETYEKAIAFAEKFDTGEVLQRPIVFHPSRILFEDEYTKNVELLQNEYMSFRNLLPKSNGFIRLRDNFNSKEEWISNSNLYGFSSRIGFANPKKAWGENPTVDRKSFIINR